MVFRRRRKGPRITKEDFERQMQSLDRHDEEHMRNRRQRQQQQQQQPPTLDSNAAAPVVEESSDPKSPESSRSRQNSHKEVETRDSKYGSPGRSRASPQSTTTSRAPTKNSPFSRFDGIGSGSKNRGRSKTEFSSDDDNDAGSRNISTPKRRYKHSKKPSPFYKTADEGSRLKKNCGEDKDTKEHASTKKIYRHNKESSPIYKPTDNEISASIDRKEKKLPARKHSATKNRNEYTKFARHNSASSVSSIDSPCAYRDIKRRRGQASDLRIENKEDSEERKTNDREKAVLFPESRAMSPKEEAPINAENDLESDSDASWDLMAKKRKMERNLTLNQGAKQEIKGGEDSDKPSRRPRDLSDSFSGQGGNKEDPHHDEKRAFQHRKHALRKRSATDNDDSEDSYELKLKKTKESSPLRKKEASRRAYCSENNESEVETDDDEHQTRPPIRQYKSKELMSTTKSREEHLPSISTETSGKRAPISFADEDDGFMSDCEPLPSPTTEKSARRKTSSRNRKDNSSQEIGQKKRRKDGGRWKSDEPETVFDDGDIPFENHRGGGSADDLHPHFENPKFGPYEPMEPLVLSSDENSPPVQVPASLSRYLAPFQKEGIRFMYDCLARKSGVILGDEMGCGKTVQVISLLCALFQKTGTRKDFIDIQERQSLVREKVRRVQRLKDQALRMGEVFSDDLEEWRASLSLSPWSPVMIIVPPTIVDTWKNAFQTFSHFSVSFYSGKTKVKAIDSMLHGGADILVVPKSAFQGESHLRELEKVNWKLIVIDEFHNFKNYKAKISEHLRELKELHNPLVLGMTGTPMQNNHTELWNLVDLVETNYFGTREDFKHNFEKPITLGRQKCADLRAKAQSEVAKAEIRKGLDKIYIKRSKKDVLKDQLPEKNEEFILCDLSPLQKEVYKHVIQLPDFDNVKHGSRPCDCGINQEFFRKLLKLRGKAEQVEYMRNSKGRVIKQSKCCKQIPINPRHEEYGQPKIDPDAAIWRTLDSHCTDNDAAEGGCDRCPWCCTLPCLTKLNKLSSHLGLLQAKKTTETVGSPAYITYTKEREFAKVALANVVDRLPGRDYDRNDGIMDDHFSLSGKLRVLNNLLQKNYDEGSKVLLFSHSTQSLDLIENWLRSRGSFEYSRMDGSTPVSRRQHLTDEFNNTDHIFLFLLSIKATGLGLNLTSANRVIMYDVSWNPSWEIQAQDRAHRIGQTRDVHVVRLISKGTVEEMIYLRQIYKEHLKQDTLEEDDNGEAPRVFRGVQGDKYRKGELFGTENLFRFKEHGSFLQDIYSVRPNHRNRGERESSGLEVHNSGKVSEVLLGMTEEERERFGEGDDLIAIKSLPRSSARNIPEDASRSVDLLESQSALALNHRDLFRSDRGGAAIKPGEDGFDEEMGGGTQAAYEAYENIKDYISEGEGGSDVDAHNENSTSAINDDDLGAKIKQESMGNIVTTEAATVMKVEQEDASREVLLKTENALLMNPSVSTTQAMGELVPDWTNSSGDIVPDAIPSTVNSSSFTHDRPSSIAAPKSSPETKHTADDSTPRPFVTSINENRGSEIRVLRNGSPKESNTHSSRKSSATKKKVLLMGCTNIGGVRTKFSAADLRRPEYGKKKKKKKRKKDQEEPR